MNQHTVSMQPFEMKMDFTKMFREFARMVIMLQFLK